MSHFSSKNAPLREDPLISPVTTPNSPVDEEKCLVRMTSTSIQFNTKEVLTYCVQNIPYLILAISVIEALIFIQSDNLRNLLRFEPNKRHQVWRYLTYMLVHDNCVHLILNLVPQCFFGFFIEAKQGPVRVGIVYLAGGLTGVLGASCLNPGLLIGASAGVYSLFISLVADFYLNYENITCKIRRSVCIAVIFSFDIFYNLYHYLSGNEPRISWEAHIFGGVAGLLLGLALYKNSDGLQEKRKNICLTFSSLVYFLLFTSLVIITIDAEASVPKRKA